VAGVDSGSFSELVGARSFNVQASNEEILLLFKKNGIYALTGNTPQDFQIITVNKTYGAFNNRCIVSVGNDIYALSSAGLVSYSSINQSGTLQPTVLGSDAIQDIIDRINVNEADRAWGIHVPARKEIMFFIPTGANTYCNEAIVYRYPTPSEVVAGRPIGRFSRREDYNGAFLTSCGLLFQDIVYIGMQTGKLGQLFRSSSYGGEIIPYTYEFPYWDAGDRLQNKKIQSAFIHGEVREMTNLNINTTIDENFGKSTFTDEVSLGSATLGSVYGSAIYGTAYYGSIDSVKGYVNTPGMGARIKFTITGRAVTSGFDFTGLSLAVEGASIMQDYI
jgi:hypothetical protein